MLLPLFNKQLVPFHNMQQKYMCPFFCAWLLSDASIMICTMFKDVIVFHVNTQLSGYVGSLFRCVRISIRGLVRWSVGPSVGWLVRRLVGNAFVKIDEK